MFKRARLLGIVGLSAIVLVTGCATPQTVHNSGLYHGAPLTHREAVRRGLAPKPPEYGCKPTYTNPDGIPMGGCI